MATRDQRVDEIMRSLGELRLIMERIEAEIGPKLPQPDRRGERPTIQQRLHKVESGEKAVEMLAEKIQRDVAAAKAIADSLDADRERNRIAQEEIAKRLSKWKTRALFAFASGAFVFGLIGALSAIQKIAEWFLG